MEAVDLLDDFKVRSRQSEITWDTVYRLIMVLMDIDRQSAEGWMLEYDRIRVRPGHSQREMFKMVLIEMYSKAIN